MGDFPLLLALVGVVFSLMAVRAFVSGSRLDYLLCGTQCLGVLLLFSGLREYALYLLLGTAVAYLVSQVLTGARPVSRLLPIAGAALVVLALWA